MYGGLSEGEYKVLFLSKDGEESLGILLTVGSDFLTLLPP